MNEKQMKQSYERIQLPPGAEERIQQRIEAALEKPMSRERVILKPRRSLQRWVPAVAAMLAIVLLSFAGLSLLRERGTNSPAAAQDGSIRQAEKVYYPGDAYYLEKYASVLDHYRTALAEEADEAECEALDVSPLCRDFYGDNPLQRLGYCLADLNGDGVPELLIGCTEAETSYGNVILDLYKWLGPEGPRKVAQSSEGQYCYDCGNGLLRLETHWTGDPNSVTSWTLYDLSAFKVLVGELTITSGNKEASLRSPAQPPENGHLVSAELVESKLSPEEADAWLERYCSTSVAHSYTPFDPSAWPAEPTATPEPVPNMTGLTDEEYESIRQTLISISRMDEPFFLTDYTARQPDGVVLLLEQIGQVAETCGITEEQIRGLFYGRSKLDGASAEAYAALMAKLYRINQAAFLSAWHETGEPVVLMHEVTGTTDPLESYRILKYAWAEWSRRPELQNDSTSQD